MGSGFESLAPHQPDLAVWLLPVKLCGLMALAGLAGAPGVTARGVLLRALAERAGLRLVRAASLYDGASRCASMVGAATGGVLIIAWGQAMSCWRTPGPSACRRR